MRTFNYINKFINFENQSINPLIITTFCIKFEAEIYEFHVRKTSTGIQVGIY